MKDKKEFESFEESRKVSEVFSFAEKNNEKQVLNEDFVFKFEDNKAQLGSDKANETQAGIEENHDEEQAKHVEKEKLDKDDIDKYSESASTSSTSSATTTTEAGTTAINPTVATVAGVTTTAVIIVVGGSIALGQTFEKPKFCQFNEVAAVANNINYTLQIGNTLEESISLDGGDECDVVIELRCPSMPEFIETQPVSRFGQVSNTFSNLSYDTEYTINAYQNQLLDVQKDYLFDKAISVRTELDVGLRFSAELDPLGCPTYFAQFAFNETIPEYMYAGLYFVDAALFDEMYPDGNFEGDGNIDWTNSSEFDPRNREKQQLNFNGNNPSGEMIAAILIEGESQTSGMGEYTRWSLYHTRVDFDNIPTSTMPVTDGIYMKRHTENYQTTGFDIYPIYSQDTSDYYNYYIKGYYYEENDQAYYLTFDIPLRQINEITEKVQIDFGNYGEYSVYDVRLVCSSRSGDATSAEEITLLTQNIDFAAMYTEDIHVDQQGVYYGTGFNLFQSASQNYDSQTIFFSLSYYDQDRVWDENTFRIDFYGAGDDEPQEFGGYLTRVLGSDDTLFRMPDLTQYQCGELQREGIYTYSIQVNSTHPEDSDSGIHICESGNVSVDATSLRTIEGSLALSYSTPPTGTDLVGEFTLASSTYLESFASIQVVFIYVDDETEYYIYDNVPFDELYTTDVPVSLDHQYFRIETYGITSNSEQILIYSEECSFGIS